MKCIEKFLILTIMITAFTLLMVEDSMAVLISHVELCKLVDDSNLVCKGKILNVVKLEDVVEDYRGAKVTVENMLASFRVDNIIKGEAPASFDIAFNQSYKVFLGLTELIEGEYVIVFLREKDGKYNFTNPYRGKIEISSKKLQVRADGTTPLALLEQELINSLTDETPKIVLSSLEVLRELKSKAAVAEIEKLLSHNNVVVKGGALFALFKIGNYAHIDEAVRYLDEVELTKEVHLYKSKICCAFGTIHDPSVVPKLHLLLKHKNDLLRKKVAESLRQIQSESSIPHLVDGLDDENAEVRYHCMMGLAKMFEKGEDWAPAYKIFLEDESKPILLWKDWWNKEGKERFRDWKGHE